jgi:hypothetical protein
MATLCLYLAPEDYIHHKSGNHVPRAEVSRIVGSFRVLQIPHRSVQLMKKCSMCGAMPNPGFQA